MGKQMWVYILASRRNGTLYIGVTSDLIRRIWEHRNDLADGFTKRYGAHQLVHYEAFDEPEFAIQREKSLKKWPRRWKLDLVEKDNPGWRDLWDDINR